MKKLKIWGILLVMAFALSACAPHMVKCPECGKVFDARDHGIDIKSGG